MLITVDGLVTRSYPTGNHDRVVHILTEEYGRLPVMVKGGTSFQSRLAAAATQPYTYGNFELYKGKGGDLYWFRSGSVTRLFFDVTADMTRTALAAYLCDIASEFSAEGDSVPETATLLRMLLNTLHILSVGGKPCELVKSVFELRTAALMGYQPDLTVCRRCGEAYPDNAYFDIMNGCFICADCQTKQNCLGGRITESRERELGERRIICPLTASTLAAMRYALTAPDRKIFSFALTDDEELHIFSRATETYLLNQLEQDFDTLKFYRSVAD